MTTPMQTTTLHCRCGAEWKIVTNIESFHAALVKSWNELHTGAGHGPTSKRNCQRSQRRADEKSLPER